MVLAGPGAVAQARAPWDRRRPVSMVTHIHSSFSEGGSYAAGGGNGSMMAHLDQATKLDVDVIWWTDHDWRMEAFGYIPSIAFDGTDEGWDLKWLTQTEGTVAGTAHAFLDDPHSPSEPGKALQVSATGSPGPDWGAALMWVKAGNSFYTTNVSDTTLTIDVLAAQVTADTQAVVEVETSYRPATAGRPAGAYVLQYRVGPQAGRRLESPLLGVVTAPATGDWQTLTLRLLDDIASFWPDLVAQDSGLARLRFGVIARNGAAGVASFDHLRFSRTRDPLRWGPRLQRSMIRRLGRRYPAVTQYMATEASMVRHLNVFMENFVLYDYPPQDGPPVLDNSVAGTEAVVKWYHDRGALVQYNHPDTTPDEVVQTRALGTDLIEVVNASGDYAVTDTRLALYDVACRNAIFLTANTQQDDHVGMDWLGFSHFFITSAWARSARLRDLLDAMGSGQVWGHDLARWPKGRLDLRVGGQRAMGTVLRTRASAQTVRVIAAGLPAGSTLDVLIGPCDRGGATPLVQRATHTSGDGDRFGLRVDLAVDHYLRIEVYDDARRLIGFGNPFWLLAGDTSIDVPRRRALHVRPGRQ